MLLLLVVSSLSPSQFWMLKTTEIQPMYLLRVKMAAMGSVDDTVDPNSAFSPALAAGSW